LRLPTVVHAALVGAATNARCTVADGLDALLCNSFCQCQVVARLRDCTESLDTKLDARLPIATVKRQRFTSEDLRTASSVYIRKLLYHFYITKNVKYVLIDGHYTLAGRHD